MFRRSWLRFRRAGPLLLVLACFLGSLPASAQTSVPPLASYSDGPAAFPQILKPYRRQSVPPPTETVLRAGVGGRKDMYVYGRQLLRLEGRVDGYAYNHFSDLNNGAYSKSAKWH